MVWQMGYTPKSNTGNLFPRTKHTEVVFGFVRFGSAADQDRTRTLQRHQMQLCNNPVSAFPSSQQLGIQ